MRIRELLWGRVPVEAIRGEADADAEAGLIRELGPISLTVIGIGAVIGSGIFVLTGTAAAQYAGPAVALSLSLPGLYRFSLRCAIPNSAR
jgi:basic amino acid/polyamine antiporter, APA family